MIEVLAALLTPSIAIAVAWISFQQWRTARAKLNLELFEKRYAVYQNASHSLVLVATHGGSRGNEAFKEMFEAWRESQFLFGAEVAIHLDNLLAEIMRVETAEGEMEQVSQDHAHQVKAKWDGIEALNAARESLPDIFKPYMLMDDRRIGTLGEWISNRNRLRLSYADEKQK